MAALEKETLLKLEKLEHLSEFLHECVHCISKPKQQTWNIDDTSGDEQWTPEELKAIRAKVQNLYRQSVLEDNFSLPSDLPENIATALTNVYKIRQTDIMNSLIKENLVNNGHNLVENIDWRLKWIMGSSKLATIREPVCQVDLLCASADNNLGTFRKVVNFEANLDKINELINHLNNVKNELDGV